jgi:glycosyltransferase involved in cell wall biosynthesis
MADAADALHCMARETPNLTASCYFLDETKMFLLPHPTYEGCQPDEISRAQARTLLNIDEKEFVFLSFGAIMEYKGYERLTAAYDLLVKMGKRNTRLVIAGFPSDKLLVQKLMVWGADRPDVILKLELVPNNDIQIYFRSADTAVFPYRRTLNSGAAMMAITFDLPVLGPNTGCFLDIETMGCGTTFDKDSEISLFAKMYKAIDQQVCTKIVLADAKKLCSPFTVSSSFFESINKLF